MSDSQRTLESVLRRARAATPRPATPRPELSDAAFFGLRSLIEKASGIAFDEDSRFILERRLLPRLRALRLADFEAYYRYLLYAPGGGAETARMLEAVTIRETYFFREPRQLDALREEVLPHLACENGASRELRIWSAGCASGEEAYSVAIIVLESGLFDGWSVRILGTDLVPAAIAAARRAVYRASSLRATDDETRERYFAREGANAWRLDERVRSMVSFDVLNLADDRAVAALPVFDVVLCRNVLIYFGEAARRRAVRAFHERLRDGGFLLLGHAETLAALDTRFRLLHLERDVVYQR